MPTYPQWIEHARELFLEQSTERDWETAVMRWAPIKSYFAAHTPTVYVAFCLSSLKTVQTLENNRRAA
jgi:hypothetical protein